MFLGLLKYSPHFNIQAITLITFIVTDERRLYFCLLSHYHNLNYFWLTHSWCYLFNQHTLVLDISIYLET